MRLGPFLLRHRQPAPPEAAPPVPGCDLYVVGDVHGCHAALDGLLRRIDDDVRERGAGPARIVFVGDYVDRGPDSAGVLETLRWVEAAHPGRAVCLRGNHEEMLLDFLDDPGGRGGRWLGHGGTETLESFGVTGLRGGPEALRDALRAAMPAGLEDWLRGLPAACSMGNVWIVHAGADPARPMPAQEPGVMVWGHPRFFDTPRRDGAWVIHGHTVRPEPDLGPGRIGIDTGAFRGGGLTAAVLAGGEGVRFLTVP